MVAWWAPSRNSVGSALSRVLLGDYAVGEVPPDVVRLGRDGDVATRLAALEARSGGTVRVEQVDAAPPPQRWVAPAAAVAPISVGPWQRQLDETWRRLSYTALSAVAHERAAVTEMVVEPEDPGSGDEPPPVLDVDDASGGRVDGDGAGGAGPVSCPLGDLPAGAAFGTLVHGILEEVDPGGETDLDGALRRAALRLGARQLLGVGGPGARAVGSGEQAVGAGELDGGSDAPGDAVEVLVSGLRVALATPLGPLAGGVRLDQVAARDRLCELEFELPLAGGDDDPGKVRRPARLADLAALLAAHLPPDDVLAGYPDRLADLGRLGGDQVLHGYLTGSLDAVLRVGPPDAPRYLVVDYKTNRLAPPGEPLTVAHYAPGPLRAAMVEAHYPLQLLLYLVALHRFLRWRQPGYDPERHLGGGLYLFVRGMVGGGAAPTGAGVAGAPPGVFGWRPPAAFVVELSRLLAGGAR